MEKGQDGTSLCQIRALSSLNRRRTVCLDDGLRTNWALRPLIFCVFSLAAAVAALVLFTV